MVQVYPGWKNVHSTKALDRLVVLVLTSRSMFLTPVKWKMQFTKLWYHELFVKWKMCYIYVTVLNLRMHSQCKIYNIPPKKTSTRFNSWKLFLISNLYACSYPSANSLMFLDTEVLLLPTIFLAVTDTVILSPLNCDTGGWHLLSATFFRKLWWQMPLLHSVPFTTQIVLRVL